MRGAQATKIMVIIAIIRMMTMTMMMMGMKWARRTQVLGADKPGHPDQATQRLNCSQRLLAR